MRSSLDTFPFFLSFIIFTKVFARVSWEEDLDLRPDSRDSEIKGEARRHCKIEFIKQVFPLLAKPGIGYMKKLMSN